jgi:hypothetical protein
MQLRKTLLTIVVGTFISTLSPGQTLFRLDFHGHARVLNSRGRVATIPIGARDLIATCVGTSALGTNKDYALVYNPSSDGVQVVSATNGALFCDLFQFQGGMTNSDGKHLDRFNFVFTPSETNAAGTVVIRENIKHGANRISMQGQIQFVLASIAAASTGSNTFDSNNTDTNATSTATNAGTAGILSPMAVAFPGLPSLSSDTNALGLTTDGGNTNSLTTPPADAGLLALPPGAGATTAISTNVSDLTSLNSPSLPTVGSNVTTIPSIPNVSSNVTTVPSVPTIPGSTLTNNLTGFVAFDTKAFGGFSFTNGVVCYGSFSGGKNIFTPSNP